MTFRRSYKKSAAVVAMLFIANGISPSLSLATDPYDPTDDLTAAFGNQCSSSGALTSTALSQSEALEGVISSIKNDPLCKGVSSDSLDADLQQNLLSKTTLQTQQLNQQQIQGQINDINAAIQAERAQPNPDLMYVETLQTNLYAAQTSLLQAQQTAGRQKAQLSAAQIASISNHGTAFMDSLSANSACINAHPNALAQVGAQILKVSSNWAPGIMGSAMLATGGLIDHFVQAINTAGINQKLKLIANSRLQHAIGCTFEGLASALSFDQLKLSVEWLAFNHAA